MRNVAWVFYNIEMPCVDAVADMEDTGIAFDLDYAKTLSEKYHKILDDKLNKFYELCDMFKVEIEAYNGPVRLDNPININSVQQIQALLYDIVGIPPVLDKITKKPTKSTGEDILKKLKHPIADAILDYRNFATLVSTFIDKLPTCVNKKDGRIHAGFNQYGADTGRFSSKNPNLQNIPSKNHDIRKMFTATDGYVLMSSDYSQQEVKGMAQMCGDEGMLRAFREGKDFYAQIASVAFNKDYEDCLEFRPDGTTNREGKERRDQAKSILLGINYGRGAISIAEQLGCTKKVAERIKEDVFRGFPAIERFEADSKAMAEDLGYVTTLWGRKRRLPIMTRADYEFEWKSGANLSDDPLDFDGDEDFEDDVPDELMRKWTKRLKDCWKSDKKFAIIKQAEEEDGLIITNNTKAKSDATRQIVNARIQGSAADMTKLAMVKLYEDERLKELGFRLLIQVHDELIAECPKENIAEVSERFARFMSEAPGDKFTIPINCDVEITERWYGQKFVVNEKGELVEKEEDE